MTPCLTFYFIELFCRSIHKINQRTCHVSSSFWLNVYKGHKSIGFLNSCQGNLHIQHQPFSVIASEVVEPCFLLLMKLVREADLSPAITMPWKCKCHAKKGLRQLLVKARPHSRFSSKKSTFSPIGLSIHPTSIRIRSKDSSKARNPAPVRMWAWQWIILHCQPLHLSPGDPTLCLTSCRCEQWWLYDSQALLPEVEGNRSILQCIETDWVEEVKYVNWTINCGCDPVVADNSEEIGVGQAAHQIIGVIWAWREQLVDRAGGLLGLSTLLVPFLFL